MNKIFEFDDRIAKEIMAPRTEMMTIEKDMTLREVFDMYRYRTIYALSCY